MFHEDFVSVHIGLRVSFNCLGVDLKPVLSLNFLKHVGFINYLDSRLASSFCFSLSFHNFFLMSFGQLINKTVFWSRFIAFYGWFTAFWGQKWKARCSSSVVFFSSSWAFSDSPWLGSCCSCMVCSFFFGKPLMQIVYAHHLLISADGACNWALPQ